MRARFYVEIDLDHRDQLPPIADDLSDRYGIAEAVWYEIIEAPLLPPYEDDCLSFDEAEAAGVDGTLRSIG